MGGQEILGRIMIDAVGQFTVEQRPLIFRDHLQGPLEQRAGDVVNTVLAVQGTLLQPLVDGRQQQSVAFARLRARVLVQRVLDRVH